MSTTDPTVHNVSQGGDQFATSQPAQALPPTSPTSTTSPSNPRKRRLSAQSSANPAAPTSGSTAAPVASASSTDPATSVTTGPAEPEAAPPAPPVKKGRTNTPWTPAEEQRLKQMRDAGNSWSEIAKVTVLKRNVVFTLRVWNEHVS